MKSRSKTTKPSKAGRSRSSLRQAKQVEEPTFFLEDTSTEGFLIRRLGEGDFDVAETGWSADLRKAACLAAFYFYGDEHSGESLSPKLFDRPNGLGMAVLAACEKVPPRGSAEYGQFVVETHETLRSMPQTSGIRSLEDMESLFMGWIALCAEELRLATRKHESVALAFDPEILLDLRCRALEILCGPPTVEPDRVTRREVGQFLGVLQQSIEAIQYSPTSLHAIYESRLRARYLDGIAKELEKAFLARLGREGTKLGSATESWRRICFLFWGVRVQGRSAEEFCQELFPGYVHLPSDKWKPVPTLLRHLRKRMVRFQSKPTLLRREFLPYVIHTRPLPPY